MADDLDAAENQVRNHVGFENDPHGLLLGRIIRFLRTLRARIEAIESRLPPQ